MDRISSTDFQRDFGRTMSSAKRSPVTVTSRGRDELVLVDVEEYERLKKLDVRQSLYAWEMNEEQLEALEKAEPSAEAQALNHLMD